MSSELQAVQETSLTLAEALRELLEGVSYVDDCSRAVSFEIQVEFHRIAQKVAWSVVMAYGVELMWEDQK